jgi:putative protein kinase ArgK-like GTPase of G3E family
MKKKLAWKAPVFEISGLTREGVKPLMFAVQDWLTEQAERDAVASATAVGGDQDSLDVIKEVRQRP